MDINGKYLDCLEFKLTVEYFLLEKDKLDSAFGELMEVYLCPDDKLDMNRIDQINKKIHYLQCNVDKLRLILHTRFGFIKEFFDI